jgi:uncharacterized protein YjiS (DUF1127 family)
MHTPARRRPHLDGFSWNPAIRACCRGFALLSEGRERERQRRSLARLDARLLADIGLSAEQRARECAKPFWL